MEPHFSYFFLRSAATHSKMSFVKTHLTQFSCLGLASAEQRLEQLNPKLEGNTKKQKNPYPPSSMAYAAWVVARLGGWSGYASQRPAGPITMWKVRFQSLPPNQL